MQTAPKIGTAAATAMVISNMVGTGVFTSLGFQLVDIQHCASILLLWGIGGCMALCGALVYAELGAALPRSGGEYVYLSVSYHPAIGFLSGFVSVSIGFAAPAALSSIAFGTYLARVFNLPNPVIPGTVLLCFLTVLHCMNIRMSASVQIAVTALNVCLILFFVMAGLSSASEPFHRLCPLNRSVLDDMMNPAFAVALVYVTYAYSGWNAAAYFAGDIAQPQTTLPRALIIGTVLVAVLYGLLNYTFLATAPVESLAGQLEIGYICAQNIFGRAGAKIIGSIISLLLLASVSSLVFIGPRITKAMGEDIRLLSFFSAVSPRNIPVRAILLQFSISLLLILTTTFEQALTYVGFTINLCSLLTVLGVMLHRRRYPDVARPFTIPLYPLPVFVFSAFMLWNLIYLLYERPQESLAGIATLGCAAIVYSIAHPRQARRI